MEVLRRVSIIKPMDKTLYSNKNNLQKKLGARIKELRKGRGLTQEALAEEMNVHPSLIGPMEAGLKFPRADTFIKLAKALKVPLYQLWMFEPDVSPKHRAEQELIDLLKKCSKKEVEFLLAIGKELKKLRP